MKFFHSKKMSIVIMEMTVITILLLFEWKLTVSKKENEKEGKHYDSVLNSKF